MLVRPISSLAPLAIAVLSLYLAHSPLLGQCTSAQSAILSPSDATVCARFGRAVSVSGHCVIAGSYGGASAERAVYVFTYDPEAARWTESAKITPEDGDRDGRFGAAVSLLRTRMVVGSPAFGTSGAAYVYRYADAEAIWIEEARLAATDGNSIDGFGSAVAVSGDWIAVGAPSEDGGRVDSGACYLYRFDADRAEWVEDARLVAPEPEASGYFGSSVSLDGGLLAVGAREPTVATNPGEAHVFRYDTDSGTWSLEATLTSDVPTAWDGFGESVGVCGDRLVVGSWGDGEDAAFSGAAFVFRLAAGTGRWGLEERLQANEPESYGLFGVSVGIAEDRIAIGAYGETGDADCFGVVHVFDYEPATSSWAEEVDLCLGGSGLDAGPGDAMDMHGDLVVVGNPLDDEILEEAGAVRVFTWSDVPCAGYFVRGDPSGNGTVDLADAILILEHLFGDAADPDCLRTVDANDDGVEAISDPVFLLGYLLQDAPAPAPPFPDCGVISDSSLSCEASPSCGWNGD